MTRSVAGRQPSARIGAITFAKLFPNPAEPFRGIFVAEQIKATRDVVDWAVVAPVPWVPAWASRLFRKPYVRGDSVFEGIPVFRPRHLLLPRRTLYATAATTMALAARRPFRRAQTHTKAQIVHAHDLYPSGAAARRLCQRAGLPYVLTVHGLDLYSNLENRFWRTEITAAAAGASAIICVGSRLAHDCVELLGVDPARIVVLPNTYDTKRFLFTPTVRRDGPPRLLSVGRLSFEKGHDVLLRAVAELRDTGSDAVLILVGDGPERGRLEALSHELGLDGIVEFRGTMLGEDLVSAMAEGDVFVLPSREEGFGVALIEAMATGLPVVATRSGGPDDIVGSEDGVLVPPDDSAALASALATVLGRLTTFDRAGIAARTAERYAPAAVGGRLVQLYTEVLSARPLTGSLASESVQ